MPPITKKKTDPYEVYRGTDGMFVHRYGVRAGAPMLPWMVESVCATGGGTDMPRHLHYQKAIKLACPDIIEWNPWMAWQFEAFCNEEYAVRRGEQTFRALGEMGCVDGATRILNPLTGEQPTIEYLYRNRIAPVVQTLEGPQQASVPFIRGVDRLYEVTLESGKRFVATHDHIVMLEDESFEYLGNLSVGARLLGYVPCPAQSNAGRGRSVRASSGPHSMRTAQGSQFDYPGDPYFGDAPPHAFPESVPSAFPLPAGALGHSLLGNTGAHPSESGDSPLTVSSLSNLDFSDLKSWLESPEFHRWREGTSLRGNLSSRQRERLRQVTHLHDSFAAPDHASAHRRFSDGFGRPAFGETQGLLSDLSQSSLRYDAAEFLRRIGSGLTHGSVGRQTLASVVNMVVPEKVVKIQYVKTDAYYDLTVPVQEHYFAEGLIHHNCAAAGKTTFSAIASFFWWLPHAHRSIVILTSTTKDKIRQRVWPWIQNLHYELQERWNVNDLHMLSSKTMLQSQKGDDKHSIFAQAVRDGETQKAIENIKGQHADRIMLVIDEAPMTPEAVLQTIPNLRKGCKEFVVIAIGNALSHLDPLGLFCEPKGGWKAVTVDHTEWRTKGVNTREHPWQVDPGACLHFDGAKSPNVIGRKTVYRHIYTWEDWCTATQTAEGQQTLQHWSNDRGFPAPEGVLRTVLSEALVEAHDARGKHTFLSQRTPIASLDPSLGGDACTAYFGAYGDIEPGKLGIQITERFIINPTINATENGRPVPIEYQVARRFAKACDERGVRPKNAAVEGDGIGHAICSILRAEWGEITMIITGGKVSDRTVSETDARTCKDAYDRRITEMCFTVQEFVKASQLKGLTDDAVLQLCSRQYEPRGGMVSVEKKEEIRDRLGRSPDDADAVCLLCELVRQNAGGPAGNRKPRRGDDWKAFVKQANEMYVAEQLDDIREESSIVAALKAQQPNLFYNDEI